MENNLGFPRMGTVKEAAKLSGLSQKCLYTLCKNGEITSVRSGNRWIINMDKLAEYLNTNKGKTTKNEVPVMGIYRINE